MTKKNGYVTTCEKIQRQVHESIKLRYALNAFYSKKGGPFPPQPVGSFYNNFIFIV